VFNPFIIRLLVYQNEAATTKAILAKPSPFFLYLPLFYSKPPNRKKKALIT